MAKISYVNGHYVNYNDACVHMEDRGYQFSDGVYEVIAFYNRRLLDSEAHIKRLIRSLNELRIDAPMSGKAMRLVMRELMDRNDRNDGTIYMQISRGVAKRDHPFPKQVRPSFVMAVTGPKIPKAKELKEGVKVITMPDIRWGRRDIKSVSLLANVLAKQAASEAGAKEAWLYDKEGLIRECSASNNAIVTAKNEIITAPADMNILSGITRNVMIELAGKAGYKVVQRPFTLKEALVAKEAFIMSTTMNLMPVTRIDDEKIGDGKPGKVTRELLGLYHEHIFQQTGKQWN